MSPGIKEGKARESRMIHESEDLPGHTLATDPAGMIGILA